MTRFLRNSLLLLVTLVAALAATAAPSLAKTVRISWQPTAHKFWQADGQAVTSLFHNGECTMWAQERRPGVVRKSVEAIIAREIAHHKPENMGDWDARYWPSDVRLAHIPTGHTPRAHALIVFQPGVLGAGSTGHIAYVQRVNRNGSFLISEMHAPALWRVTHQRLSAADARLHGVTFIY
jgi:surface antigen